MRDFIKKLRGLPEIERKIIFFVVMGLAVIIVGYFAFQSMKAAVAGISNSIQSVHVPQILPDVPPSVLTQEAAPDPIATWQTYTNDEVGFSIKYPADFTVKKYPKLIGADFSPAIGFYAPETPLSAQDWIAKKFAVTVTGASPWRFILPSKDITMYHAVFVAEPNRIVDVYYGAGVGDTADIYENMLSTFTFITK